MKLDQLVLVGSRARRALRDGYPTIFIFRSPPEVLDHTGCQRALGGAEVTSRNSVEPSAKTRAGGSFNGAHEKPGEIKRAARTKPTSRPSRRREEGRFTTRHREHLGERLIRSAVISSTHSSPGNDRSRTPTSGCRRRPRRRRSAERRCGLGESVTSTPARPHSR
jgi:hypothetical protein